MSKQIPQDELNKKFSYRLKQWMKGDVDQYVGLVEMQRQDEVVVSKREVNRHKKEQDKLFAEIYDTENNKVYKNFLLFYAIERCLIIVYN